jgi:protein involved in plasmid replication-relaxation
MWWGSASSSTTFLASPHESQYKKRPFRGRRLFATDPSLWDKVTTSANKEPIPIRPDALFTIAWPAEKGRAHFFLEADTGSMDHSRMREKITGYAAWFHQQRHMKKFEGMKVFRVATVTKTRRRAEELSREFRGMMPAAWLAAYPVIAFEDLTLEALMP